MKHEANRDWYGALLQRAMERTPFGRRAGSPKAPIFVI
jgi:hypothetical protein